MKKFFLSMGIIAAAFFVLASSAFASSWQPYSDAAFTQAQKAGNTIVLDFHAPWCPTCRKQKPILEELLKMPKFDAFVGFTVDYDTAGELKKKMKVSKQSTIIIFKGEQSVARSVGSTKKKNLETLFEKGL